MRLLYVALTRAEQQLHIIGTATVVKLVSATPERYGNGLKIPRVNF